MQNYIKNLICSKPSNRASNQICSTGEKLESSSRYVTMENVLLKMRTDKNREDIFFYGSK